MTVRSTVLISLPIATAGCAATPYDFPVPTMIGDRQGVSMTGFMKTDSEDEVRRRLTDRMRCPDGVEFASLTTARADNRLGTHILRYKAVMRCADGAAKHAPVNATGT